MSGISDLAKAFEENSKQQAQHTETHVKAEFQKLNAAISAELNSSVKSINNAIQDVTQQHQQRLKTLYQPVMKRLWIGLSFIALICAGLIGGTYWYLSQQLDEIQANEQSLAVLNSKTGKGIVVMPGTGEEKGTYYIQLPKSASNVETYQSRSSHLLVKYQAK
uniref:MbeB family mobilization protein n=1 Tax=Rosenbergiella nectarea TaxID=988801 RepID=UPI000B83C06F